MYGVYYSHYLIPNKKKESVSATVFRGRPPTHLAAKNSYYPPYQRRSAGWRSRFVTPITAFTPTLGRDKKESVMAAKGLVVSPLSMRKIIPILL